MSGRLSQGRKKKVQRACPPKKESQTFFPHLLHNSPTGTGERYFDEGCKRRIFESFPSDDFFSVKINQIALEGVLNHALSRHPGLDQKRKAGETGTTRLRLDMPPEILKLLEFAVSPDGPV